jgi:hypothetical protein
MFSSHELHKLDMLLAIFRDHFQVTDKEIRSLIRTGYLVDIRCMYAAIAIEVVNEDGPRNGFQFDLAGFMNRKHCAITFYKKRFADLIQFDPKFKATYDELLPKFQFMIQPIKPKEFAAIPQY